MTSPFSEAYALADVLAEDDSLCPSVEKVRGLARAFLDLHDLQRPILTRETVVKRLVWGPDDDYRVVEFQVDGADLKTGDRVTVKVYR